MVRCHRSRSCVLRLLPESKQPSLDRSVVGRGREHSFYHASNLAGAWSRQSCNSSESLSVIALDKQVGCQMRERLRDPATQEPLRLQEMRIEACLHHGCRLRVTVSLSLRKGKSADFRAQRHRRPRPKSRVKTPMRLAAPLVRRCLIDCVAYGGLSGSAFVGDANHGHPRASHSARYA